jgi:hypothetical protein
MISALFLDITQPIVAIPHRSFGITCQIPSSNVKKSKKNLLTFEGRER